jgi:membrane fusion protein, copper/silver efflux system
MSDSTEKTAAAENETTNEAAAPKPAGHSRRWWVQKLFSAGIFATVGLLLIVAVGAAQKIGWISAGGGPAATGDDVSKVIHMCPMHPHIRQMGPGKCSICGMNLEVPQTSGADLDELAVKIAPAQRRLANIQTGDVRREPISAMIQTVGAIAIDESRMATIPSYIDGRIERLFADYTGVDVKKDDHLAVVYSPNLFTAQVAYLEFRRLLEKMNEGALKSVRTAQEMLVKSSRQRLVELGMTDEQIAGVEKSGEAQSRLTIYSNIGGTVIEKLAQEGKYVKAGDPIYRIAYLSTVWLMLELYPEDAIRIRFGQRVKAEMQSLPGRAFDGRVAYIDRTVDEKKRTVGVRVEFLNEEQLLRPGDYASAEISLQIGEQGEVYDAGLAGKWISPMHPQIVKDQPGPCPICGMDLVPTSRFGYAANPVEQPTSLFVPRSALLMAGASSVVYVETEPGRFEIRPVVLGPVLRDRVVILSGLKEGEKVATAGNFLIDSQMQLAGKPSLIDPARAIARQRERKTPLEFDKPTVKPLDGESGSQLESLYSAYFEIQKTLAADKKPTMKSATALHKLATKLAGNKEIPAESRDQLKAIARSAEHLHHMKLAEARMSFKPVSHAVVTLATQYRGEKSTQSFTHFFCPMVDGGGGDWLQPGGDLRNPYKGSEMLTCGRKAHDLPVTGPIVSLLKAKVTAEKKVHQHPKSED